MTIKMDPEDTAKLPSLLYNAHHQGHLEDIPFWLEMAARQGDPILELGCGTGRTLIPLDLEGYQVYGLDIDFGMLETLISKQLSNSIRPLKVFQADASAFRLAVEFSLVLMPCNIFSSFSEEKRQAILKSVSAHLSVGGRFVVSVPNPSLLESLPTCGENEMEEVIQHPVTGNPVQVINSWERSGQVFKLNWHYDHLLPDGIVDRVTIKINHQIIHVDVYRDEFLRAGMLLSNVYGDFDFSEYRPDSTNLILIATKN